GEAGHDLAHARIGGAQHAVERTQGLDLVFVAEALDRIHGRIQARCGHRAPATHERARRQFASVAGDGARGPGRIGQRDRIDVVGIGEAGLLAGDRAHAHALLDRVRTVLDDAVLYRPAFAARVLEIQVAGIDAGPEQRAERAIQA